ncbi:MAG TPA: hypothetical protein VIP70_01950 [Nitrososphaeraceae archaeon]
MPNTKRLGRFSRSNDSRPDSQSSFELKLASFYKDTGWKSSLLDLDKPLFLGGRSLLEKCLHMPTRHLTNHGNPLTELNQRSNLLLLTEINLFPIK